MSDAPGEVLGLDGRRHGRTDSLERTFVAAAEEAVRRGGTAGVYAVVGPDSSASFRERLGAVCPVVVDEGADGVAMILSGSPGEWEALGDAP